MRAAVDGNFAGSATCRMAGAILPGVEVCERRVRHRTAARTILSLWALPPMDNPKIAIAVYVENGGFGASVWRTYRCHDDGPVSAWKAVARE